MDNFNANFCKLVSHVMDLGNYLKAKERAYLSQIESLTRQNQVLFDENIQLNEKVLTMTGT